MIGPLILHHRIRLKRIGTDLRSEADLVFISAECVLEFGLALASLLLEDEPAEHLHRRLTVLMLGALIFAADDKARRDMADTDRGFGPVDVLSARATRAHRRDLKIVILQLDRFEREIVFEIGHDAHGRKSRMAPRS